MDANVILAACGMAVVLPLLQSLARDKRSKARLGDALAVVLALLTSAAAEGGLDPQTAGLVAVVIKWGSQATYDGVWKHAGINERTDRALGRLSPAEHGDI